MIAPTRLRSPRGSGRATARTSFAHLPLRWGAGRRGADGEHPGAWRPAHGGRLGAPQNLISPNPEVQYSLLHRKPETNGVLDACRRMDVALVAYRPLSGGAVGSSSSKRSDRPALADTLREVAASHGATVTQVALAWLLKRDGQVIPIPGATSPEHARENAGALSLDLDHEQFAAIDRASAASPPAS